MNAATAHDTEFPAAESTVCAPAQVTGFSASGLTGHDGFVMRMMAMQGLGLHRPEHC